MITADDVTNTASQDAPAQNGDGWRTDRQGKEFVPRQGKSGIIYRQGDETVEQARERDQRPRDQRPRKPKSKPKPRPPKQTDLRELEKLLTEVFCAPAIPCASFGDLWAAEHFTKQGPMFARNLVNAAEHNPWLRRKLEELASGEDAMMRIFVMVPVVGGLITYALPPAIWWFNLPVPAQARMIFQIPDRRPENAPSPPPNIPATPPGPPAAA